MVKSFNQVAVIGAGTMGHGLALLFALGGSRVCLVDVGRDCLETRAMELIRSHLRGLDLQQQYDIAMDEVLALITPELALGGADRGVRYHRGGHCRESRRQERAVPRLGPIGRG